LALQLFQLFLGFLLHLGFGLTDRFQTLLRIGQVGRQGIGGLSGTVAQIFLRIGLFGGGQQVLDNFFPVG
jgi:hypothetical protein